MSMLLQIVITFFKIGAVSFGGGYAAIPIIQKYVVDINGWMTNSEFMNVLAMDELTPGPIAINCATFVGVKMAGIPGAIAATFGNVLPSFFIALILIRIYMRFKNMTVMNGALAGLKCMVVALIFSTTLTLFNNAILPEGSIDVFACIIFAIALFIFRKFKVEPLLIILGCGAVGLLFYLFF